MSANGIALAIGGNFAIQKTITPDDSRETLNGAAYYAAVGASVFAESGEVGVWTRVGKSDDEEPHVESLRERGVDTRGVAEVAGGKIPVFTFTYDASGARTFSAEMGLGASVDLTAFPAEYESAHFVHLATNDPDQYLEWMRELRPRMQNAVFSIDLFEEYVRVKPQETVGAMQLADLVFVNKEEYGLLPADGRSLLEQRPYVLKSGAGGAEYIDRQRGLHYTALAPGVTAKDTTGAGDILAGAFLAQRAKGVGIPAALQNAVNTASASVTRFGVEHLTGHM